jgi:hypothetical protein
MGDIDPQVSRGARGPLYGGQNRIFKGKVACNFAARSMEDKTEFLKGRSHVILLPALRRTKTEFLKGRSHIILPSRNSFFRGSVV